MQFTKKASYGLIAALELARSDGDRPTSAATIADRYKLPAPFVEKILHVLKTAGVVRSKQGRGGGYLLAAPADAVSVRSVLGALDEEPDLVSCIADGSDCSLTDICPTRGAWHVIHRRFLGLLDSLTLQDLLDDQPR